VYGITRRGYGASSRPESGYSADRLDRLADDVLAVLDARRLKAPVLAGHSLGGQELTVLASAHPHRIAGLVYIDGLVDLTFDWKPYQELQSKLPAAMKPTQPSIADYRSFQAYRDWQMMTMGIAFPESELRQGFRAKPDGTMGSYLTPTTVRDAIHAGGRKPDYSGIRVPVLAFVVLPKPLQEQERRYHPRDDAERALMEQLYAADLDVVRGAVAALRAGVPDARVVELPGANHYVFLSNEADVLRETRAFLLKVK